MAVQVVDSRRIVSDRSDHHARSVGCGGWVVSFLPGRTLTFEQAVAAMRVAEAVGEMVPLSCLLGLTAVEAVGHVVWPVRFEDGGRCTVDQTGRPAWDLLCENGFRG
ncbi:hypothetical protein [Nocardia macrotermitis]|uniref:hypothetical protein n=1 Tax=Nocardia macrotermitis TaxID=2585198 RepID=UPI001885D109|nr:hypothetical protein [Nocardia macrotermitis]